MFNLFPKKKSVDEIIEDADVTPAWQWQPTQTPSMLQAQNELIEQFLKENHDLKLEIQKLKNDWHQPELCDEKIVELTKEVLQLRHLKQENVKLMEYIKNLREQQNFLYQENEKLKAQNHPMYPLHWGGYDGTASAFPEEYSSHLNKLKKEAVTLEDLPKTFPNEFQDKKTWEDAASDLALRVVKLEKKVEELTIIKMTSDPNYQYFLKHGNWPYSALNEDGTLKTISC